MCVCEREFVFVHVFVWCVYIRESKVRARTREQGRPLTLENKKEGRSETICA